MNMSLSTNLYINKVRHSVSVSFNAPTCLHSKSASLSHLRMSHPSAVQMSVQVAHQWDREPMQELNEHHGQWSQGLRIRMHQENSRGRKIRDAASVLPPSQQVSCHNGTNEQSGHQDDSGGGGGVRNAAGCARYSKFAWKICMTRAYQYGWVCSSS
jgi:hypothetical protein